MIDRLIKKKDGIVRKIDRSFRKKER